MAGHNKWSKIKRVKGVLDARRGKIFSRLSKEITVAAKLGGGDPEANARLRSAILAARAENMPSENIERAIKKGTGELQSEAIEEILYEAYAPGGIALMIEAATDNRNRTTADLRSILTKNGGSLASSGSVSYMFHRKGRIAIPINAIAQDALLELILDAGAEELLEEDSYHIVLTPPSALYQVIDALKHAAIEPESAKLTFIPENIIPITDSATASQILKICDQIDDHDDIQAVHANFEIADDLLNSLTA